MADSLSAKMLGSALDPRRLVLGTWAHVGSQTSRSLLLVLATAGVASMGRALAQTPGSEDWAGSSPISVSAAAGSTPPAPPAGPSLTYNGSNPVPTQPGFARGILFVTQPPIADDFATANSVFGNHRAEVYSTPRGGDLYLRYENGTLRNLTQEAGFGLQQYQEIAVREPSVHWSGAKALFSMVIGGTQPNVLTPVYWQIYEVTGLEPGQTVQIKKIPQPANSNNVSPFYGNNGRILFTSDRPRHPFAAPGPQLDEYESTPANSGLWTMKSDGTDLRLIDHAPSGDFTPILASDGRIIFCRWDHLQRDQLWYEGQVNYGAYDNVSELSALKNAAPLEVFPEPLSPPGDGVTNSHHFNHFFPWQINEDGTGLETLNHVGRNELLAYFEAAKYYLPHFFDPTQKVINGFFLQIKEDPTKPGRFYGTTAPEFNTHGAGQIVRLDAQIGLNADDMEVDWITDPITLDPIPSTQPAPPGHPGHFRNPLPLEDGRLLAVRTSSPYKDKQVGPGPLHALYDFHLSWLQKQGTYWVPTGKVLSAPITKSVSYYSNYVQQTITYSGPLWELDPVELAPRPRPISRTEMIPDIELAILKNELGGNSGVKKLQKYLKDQELALVVSRDVTRRADKQQDFNLKVAGSPHQTAQAGSTPVEVGFLQFLQGDMIRGYTNYSQTIGRRVIARPMHDAKNPPVPGTPAGAVRVASDGSTAAFVPANRALTWQLTKTDGAPVVRERFWTTFAPGEIRTCANCHGVNKADVVLGQPAPTNPPQALKDLLGWYKDVTQNGTTGRTIGVFQPALGNVFLRNANSAGTTDLFFKVNTPVGWQPITGDWDGDGVESMGFYDPATSTFRLSNALDGSVGTITFTLGAAGSGFVAVAGDWDGDGRDSVGLYQPSTGTFQLTNVLSSAAPEKTFAFGPTQAIPVAGNWDGQWGDSIGVYVPATGEFQLRNVNSAGPPAAKFFFGTGGNNQTPIVGDWDNDGTDTVGVYGRTTGQFLLRNLNSPGAPHVDFYFGPIPGGTPLVGDWNGG